MCSLHNEAQTTHAKLTRQTVFQALFVLVLLTILVFEWFTTI